MQCKGNAAELSRQMKRNAATFGELKSAPAPMFSKRGDRRRAWESNQVHQGVDSRGHKLPLAMAVPTNRTDKGRPEKYQQQAAEEHKLGRESLQGAASEAFGTVALEAISILCLIRY